MIQWFFLNRIDTEAAGAPVGGQHHGIVQTPTHEAQTALSLAQFAKPRAQIALNAFVIQPMPVLDGPGLC